MRICVKVGFDCLLEKVKGKQQVVSLVVCLLALKI